MAAMEDAPAGGGQARPTLRVITVGGPVDPTSLGVVDAHEHLFLDSPALPGQAFSDPERAIAELREGRDSGIGAIVEMTPIGLGRRPDLMRAASEATAVPIVAATGGGSLVPGTIRSWDPSAAKSRADTPNRSSSFPAEAGMNGCTRIATCRSTSAATKRPSSPARSTGRS